MDQASTLVAELHSKLDELDAKVSTYRQQMTAEFGKYKDELLRDAPADVVSQVDEALRDRIGTSVAFQDIGKAGASNVDATETSLHLPSPVMMSAVQAQVDAGPRSPHEREKEFQGLFTPSYLPLLDSTDRHERRSLSLTSIPTLGEVEAKPIPSTRSHSDETGIPTVSSFDDFGAKQKPPKPKRRNTDEISVHSDHSEGTSTRRSALRRSSSGAKQGMASPRRVRFEFAGQEFPTTSSPMTEIGQLDLIPPMPVLSSPSDEERTTEEHVEYVQEREESPPPKRISSSQALRALSQRPIEDDGTQWTEVIAPPDGSASVERTDGDGDGENSDSEVEFLGIGSRNGKGKGKAVMRSNGSAGKKKGLKSPPPEPVTSGDTEDTLSDHDGDEALLAMEPISPMKSPTSKSYSTTIAPQLISHSANSQAEKFADKFQTASTTSKATATAKPAFGIPNENDPNLGKLDLSNTNGDGADDEDDEPFEFDEAPQKPSEKYAASESDSPASDDEESEDEAQDVRKYSTSPGRAILKSNLTSAIASSASPPVQVANNSNPAQKSLSGNGIRSDTRPPLSPTGKRESSGSGSYRPPHPFNTPIVSREIHAQAASLGAVSSFVGSVNGTTGVDNDFSGSYTGTSAAANIGSVMGSGVGSFRSRGSAAAGGRALSMSERMAREEEMGADDGTENGRTG